MRIPAEAVTLYLTEVSPTPVADARRAEPVNDAPQMDSASEHPALNFAAIAREAEGDKRESEARPRSAVHRHFYPQQPKPATPHHPYIGPDRRKAERRKAGLPILLDTRTQACRREETWALKIDFSI